MFKLFQEHVDKPTATICSWNNLNINPIDDRLIFSNWKCSLFRSYGGDENWEASEQHLFQFEKINWKSIQFVSKTTCKVVVDLQATNLRSFVPFFQFKTQQSKTNWNVQLTYLRWLSTFSSLVVGKSTTTLVCSWEARCALPMQRKRLTAPMAAKDPKQRCSGDLQSGGL